jgi:hypothetical protein
MTHKEFYIWLEGYLTGKLENKNIDITPIVEKMGQVKDEEFKSSMLPFQNIPIHVNPLPKHNPTPPSWDITFENKKQLND